MNRRKTTFDRTVGLLYSDTFDFNGSYQESHKFICELFEMLKKIPLKMFVFGKNDIDWTNKKILGNTLINNNWVQNKYEFPDLIFIRRTSIGKRLKPLENKISFINSPDLIRIVDNKYETYRFLKNLGLPQPKTNRFTLYNLRKFINRKISIYLKPNKGLKGHGQYCLSYKNNKIIVKKSDNSKPLQFDSFEDFNSFLSTLNLKNYIIQETIKIIRHNRKIFDIRVLMQKDNVGIWKLTGMTCRVGKINSITSNLDTGGKVEKTTKVLKKIFGVNKYHHKIGEIRKIAFRTVKSLENKVKFVGELGLDLLINEKGKIIIIEINSKPGRAVFRPLGINPKNNRNFREVAVRRPLEYAKYLLDKLE